MKTKCMLFLVIVIFLSGCEQPSNTSSQDLGWNVQVTQAEVKEAMETTEIVTLYTGDKNEVNHENMPNPGNVYVILELVLTKTKSETGSFDWDDLALEDVNGNKYQRLENDSFLELHNYSPRMTGLPIRFGESTGWVCYEITKEEASGTLVLVYTSSKGKQIIEIKH